MKIKKIVISCQNKAILKKITTQQPIPVFAKKSIANFGVREGQITNFIVTLRRKRLKAFLDRFCGVILPAQSRFQGFNQKNTPNSQVELRDTFTINLADSISFFQPHEIDKNIQSSTTVGLRLSFHLDQKNETGEKIQNFNDFLRQFPTNTIKK